MKDSSSVKRIAWHEVHQAQEDVEDRHHECYELDRLQPLRGAVHVDRPEGEEASDGTEGDGQCEAERRTRYRDPKLLAGGPGLHFRDVRAAEKLHHQHGNLPSISASDLHVSQFVSGGREEHEGGGDDRGTPSQRRGPGRRRAVGQVNCEHDGNERQDEDPGPVRPNLGAEDATEGQAAHRGTPVTGAPGIPTDSLPSRPATTATATARTSTAAAIATLVSDQN